jgi:hypothetical protein
LGVNGFGGNASNVTKSGSDISVNAGESVEVRFCAAWDDNNLEPDPAWQITSVNLSSSASVPFEFSPTLGLLTVGGIIGISRLRKSLATPKLGGINKN